VFMCILLFAASETWLNQISYALVQITCLQLALRLQCQAGLCITPGSPAGVCKGKACNLLPQNAVHDLEAALIKVMLHLCREFRQMGGAQCIV